MSISIIHKHDHFLDSLPEQLIPSPVKQNVAKIKKIANPVLSDRTSMLSPQSPSKPPRELPFETPTKKRKSDLPISESPCTPLSPNSTSQRFGIVTSPYFTHNPETFSKTKKQNSKIKKAVKKAIKDLENKPCHTWEIGSSPQQAHPKNAGADKNGLIKHNLRLYKLHPERNPGGNNKLIPVKGRNLIRMTGLLAKKLYNEYAQSSTTELFGPFLERTCSELHAQTFPESPATLRTTGLDFMNVRGEAPQPPIN